MFSRKELTESEKIDQTHALLKSMQRGRWYSIFFRIFMLVAIYAGYLYLAQPENSRLRERIKSEFSARLSEFVTPIARDLMSSMISSMASSGSTSNLPPGKAPQITPEMIQAVQNSMQK